MTGKKAGINRKMYRKPIRIFEKSGSVNPEASYHVPLENVVNTDNQDIKTMVDRGRYFSIFAPRQSGKTTFLKRISEQLHTDPTYVAVMSKKRFKSCSWSETTTSTTSMKRPNSTKKLL